MSIRPGVTYRPEASTTFAASSAGMSFSTAAILPSKTATSLFPSKPFAGSMTWPPLSSKSYRGNGLLATCALATKTTNNAVDVQIAFAVCRMRTPFDAGNFLFQKPGFAPNWMSRLSSACSPSPKRVLPTKRVTLVLRLIVPRGFTANSDFVAVINIKEAGLASLPCSQSSAVVRLSLQGLHGAEDVKILFARSPFRRGLPVAAGLRCRQKPGRFHPTCAVGPDGSGQGF